MKKTFLIFLILCISNTFAQKDPNVYDFFGGKTFGNQATFYRLLFKINNGKISGYAFTGDQRSYETKSIINGTFNPKTKRIIFSETKKLVTKSRKRFDELCFLNAVISMEINPRISKIKGSFIEETLNGTKCSEGDINIISLDVFHKLQETIKVEKRLLVENKPKPEIKVTEVLPTFETDEKITIKDDEEITIFWSSDKFILDIWDDAKEDDDQITIQFNDEIILEDYILKNKKETLEFDLEKNLENKITFTATNTGFIANNTARVDLFDATIKHQIITELKLNKSVTVFLVKQ